MSTVGPAFTELGRSPIVQLCFVTNDLAASVAAFTELTGLAPGPVSIAANEVTPTTYKGKTGVVRARTCAFSLPNIQVEFLEPGPEPSVWRDTLDARGPSLHHIAFQSENLAAAQSALTGKGVPCSQAADFVNGGGKYAVFDTANAIGTMIELFALTPPSGP